MHMSLRIATYLLRLHVHVVLAEIKDKIICLQRFTGMVSNIIENFNANVKVTFSYLFQ